MSICERIKIWKLQSQVHTRYPGITTEKLTKEIFQPPRREIKIETKIRSGSQLRE